MKTWLSYFVEFSDWFLLGCLLCCLLLHSLLGCRWQASLCIVHWVSCWLLHCSTSISFRYISINTYLLDESRQKICTKNWLACLKYLIAFYCHKNKSNKACSYWSLKSSSFKIGWLSKDIKFRPGSNIFSSHRCVYYRRLLNQLKWKHLKLDI